MTVYLVHLDQPLAHARHYLGYAADHNLTRRLAHHEAGRGARLLAVARSRGISWRLVRTWPGGDRTLERRLKAHSSTIYCPECNPATAHARGVFKRDKT